MRRFILQLPVRLQIFTVVFLFGVFLSFLGAFSSYILRVNQSRESLLDNMNAKILSAESIMRREIVDMKTMLLSTGEVFSGAEGHMQSHSSAMTDIHFMDSFMLMMAKTNNSIMQFRLIDMTGSEKIRIERPETCEVPVKAEDNKLLADSFSHFFTSSMKIKQGEVWVSDLDITTDDENMGMPPRATFRLATPYIVNGKNAGAITISAFAEFILQGFTDISDVDIHIADIKGFYLPHEKNVRLPEQRGNLFDDFPELRSLTVNGVYSDNKTTVAKKVEMDAGRWFYVVYRIQPSYIWNIHKQHILMSIALYMVSIVAAFALSYMISGYSSRRYIEKVAEADNVKETAEKMTKKLSELAKRVHRDPLTGVFNRRYFDEVVCSGISNDVRYGLAVIDIDHFKAVNDDFGHDAGDRVLLSLASLISAHIRESDILTRWGGEEFCLTVFGVTESGLRDICEKLRLLISGHDFEIGRRVTCSFGVSIRAEYETVEEVFKRADTALYKAKNAGRNRVCTG
jgi:diguanylate cyclase (GGDEF)-like protein